MNFIDSLKNEIGKNIKTIVLPEGNDKRILKAAEIVLNENLANIIILGNKEEITNSNYNLDKAIIIDPSNSNITEEYINKLVNIRKEKGLDYDSAKDLILNNYMYFASLLVIDGKADGIVSGACSSTADTLKPALQVIKTKPGHNKVSSFFVIEVPNCNYGENGLFIFSDCALIQDPDSNDLTEIAKVSADSFYQLTGKEPVIAMLSHSTLGSAKHNSINKVSDAVKLFKNKYPNYKIEGELQLDSAIIPEVAEAKAPDSIYAGHANVLVFPNIDAANIGYKLVQRLAKANAYGPICQGINAPVSDLSRGCLVDDIIASILITSLEANKNYQ